MRLSGLMRPSTTLASVTVGSVPPRRYATGPGIAPALRGPTCSMPPRSRCAMLPPPAPIVCTSIIGSRSGMRKSRLVSSATSGSPSIDHRDVEARAAHVAGDHVAEAGLGGDARRRGHACRGARAHDVRGAAAELAQRRHAAVGLHDRDLAVVAPAVELGREVLRVARDQRLQVALHHRGAGALELVVLAHHRRGGDELPGRLDRPRGSRAPGPRARCWRRRAGTR